MIILRIEHKVPDFDGWKKVFESDPIGRKKSGVRRYRILRPVDDPNNIIIDLEFESLDEATNTLTALRNLWNKVEGTVVINPKTLILDLVEAKEVQ